MTNGGLIEDSDGVGTMCLDEVKTNGCKNTTVLCYGHSSTDTITLDVTVANAPIGSNIGVSSKETSIIFSKSFLMGNP